MKTCTLILAIFLNVSAFGALPGVTEFKTPPENITDSQLAALLRERVAAADVIAIGETVHGSSTMLRLQTRLVRYLVSNHGLRLIVWENPALRSHELTRWLASCVKTKTPAPLDVLYMPTSADLALFEWLCDYNLAQPADPVVFRGMDIWDRPWEHYARLRTLGPRFGLDAARLKAIAAVCPAYAATSWADIDAVFAQRQSDGKFLPLADYEKCHAQLTTLLDTVTPSGLGQPPKIQSAANDAFDLAISVSTLLGWLGFYHYELSNDVLSWNARDQAQGRNLMLMMAQHNARRAIVTAHTSHTSHNRSRADWWGFGDIKSGVYFFGAMTRKKVFSLALTAYAASGTQGHWSLPTASNSLDKTLHDAGHQLAYFPSNAAFLSKHARWWMQNQNSPGPFESGVEIIPADHFDAFFFFDQSFVDKPLPARPMWRP